MRPVKNPRLGKFLSKARADKGVTLRDLETASGVEYSYIGRLERGEVATPDPTKLVKLARALDIEIEDVYAAAGYTNPALPEFAQYLRSKYDLHDTEVGEIERYFERLRRRYEADGTKKKRGSGGKSAR